jgi:hypothetical protein
MSFVFCVSVCSLHPLYTYSSIQISVPIRAGFSLIHIPYKTAFTIILDVKTRTNTDSHVLFSRTPGIGYDISKNEGIPFKYFTYGAACSEVEIDCLTGDHQVTLQIISKYVMFYIFSFVYILFNGFNMCKARYYNLEEADISVHNTVMPFSQRAARS